MLPALLESAYKPKAHYKLWGCNYIREAGNICRLIYTAVLLSRTHFIKQINCSLLTLCMAANLVSMIDTGKLLH